MDEMVYQAGMAFLDLLESGDHLDLQVRIQVLTSLLALMKHTVVSSKQARYEFQLFKG